MTLVEHCRMAADDLRAMLEPNDLKHLAYDKATRDRALEAERIGLARHMAEVETGASIGPAYRAALNEAYASLPTTFPEFLAVLDRMAGRGSEAA